jgi:P4 family phage/plasmid primase-like protien
MTQSSENGNPYAEYYDGDRDRSTDDTYFRDLYGMQARPAVDPAVSAAAEAALNAYGTQQEAVTGKKTKETGNSDPYRQAASSYRQQGWNGVLPIKGKKRDLPAGFTGRQGKYPTDTQVTAWVSHRGSDNIALRLPPDVIGLDIDAHNGRNGLRTIEAFERSLGKLPPTFKSSARDDGSGILFFRLSQDHDTLSQRYVSDLGTDSGVEIIRYGHRFAVVWPSIHPGNHPEDEATGRQYVWRTPDEELMSRPPSPEDLPLLPQPWVHGLMRHTGTDEFSSETSSETDKTDAVDSHLMLVIGAPPGEQNNRMFSYICHLRARRLSREEAIALGMVAVQRMKNTRPEDPWTIQHVQDMVRRVWSEYAPGTTGEQRAKRAQKELGKTPEMISWAQGFTSKESQESAEETTRKEEENSEKAADPPSGTAFGIQSVSVVPGRESATDTGNADRLARLLKGRLRYIPEYREWHEWTGSRWLPIDDSRALELTRIVPEDIRNSVMESGATPEETEAFGSWAQASESKARRDAMLALAQGLDAFRVFAAELDADPSLLACANGVIELHDDGWIFREPRPEDKISLNTGTVFDPGARSDDWDRLITWVQPDSSQRQYLQAVDGYSLFGNNFRRYLPVLHGATNTGKTTHVELNNETLGEYATICNMSLFRGNLDERPRADIVQALSSRRVSVSEAGTETQLHADQLKRITGNDKLTARLPHAKGYVTRYPAFIPILAFNEMPQIAGLDKALMKRLVVIPFGHDLESDPTGEMLKVVGRLRKDPPRSAILNWLLAGWDLQCRGVIDSNRPPGAQQEESRRSAIAEMSPFDAFVDEYCTVGSDPDCWDTAERLALGYQAFTQGDGGYQKLSGKQVECQLSRHLKRRGYRQAKRSWVTWEAAQGGHTNRRPRLGSCAKLMSNELADSSTGNEQEVMGKSAQRTVWYGIQLRDDTDLNESIRNLLLLKSW